MAEVKHFKTTKELLAYKRGKGGIYVPKKVELDKPTPEVEKTARKPRKKAEKSE